MIITYSLNTSLDSFVLAVNPNDSGAILEDDGILLSIVFDGNKKQSYLLLLDAWTFRTVARLNRNNNIERRFQ